MSRFESSLVERALRALGKPAPAPPPPAEAPDVLALTAALCRRFEGFSEHPYLCPAGVPTIGYGATHYLDGRAVRLTDAPLSREAAERLLVRTLERDYRPALQRLCPALDEHDPLDARRLAALLDFVFNLGAARLAASTLRQRVNAGHWDEVPAELRKWVRGGGRVLRGLQLRREAEIALLAGP